MFVTAEQKQGSIVSLRLISPGTSEMNGGKNVKTLPCKRKRTLLMEEAGKMKKPSDGERCKTGASWWAFNGWETGA